MRQPTSSSALNFRFLEKPVSVGFLLSSGSIDRQGMLRKLNYYSRLRKVVTYLEGNPGEPITLTQAARIACMERTSFSRLFSRAAGITFRDFLQQWRVAIAQEQISGSDGSLTEIAYASGFESMSAFERTFKKITMLNPSEYRRQLLARAFGT